jgi:hypothetical protein
LDGPKGLKEKRSHNFQLFAVDSGLFDIQPSIAAGTQHRVALLKVLAPQAAMVPARVDRGERMPPDWSHDK